MASVEAPLLAILYDVGGPDALAEDGGDRVFDQARLGVKVERVAQHHR